MFSWIKRHKATAAFIAAVLVLIAIIAISYYNGSSKIGKGVSSANAAASEPVSSFFGNIRSEIKGLIGFHSLMRENEELQEEIDSLKRENTRNKLDEKELAELRELQNALNYQSEDQEYEYVSAKIVATDNSRYFNSFTINAGTESGIKENDVVLSGNGLVGRVSEVGEGYARVLAVIDDNLNVSFEVSRNMEILGVVTGDGSGNLTGYTLDDEAGIVEGDTLLSTGIGMYPEGIEIGKVTGVSYDNDEMLLTITAEPAVDFLNLRKVMVLI